MDARAAAAHRRILAALPEEERERVAHIPREEVEHAMVQAEIADRLTDWRPAANTPYINKMIYRPDDWKDPRWSAAWLAAAERMYSLSFKAVARRARELGLGWAATLLEDVAADEHKHVGHGLRSLQVLGGITRDEADRIAREMDWWNQFDSMVALSIPQGLGIRPFRDLGGQIARRLLMPLAR